MWFLCDFSTKMPRTHNEERPISLINGVETEYPQAEA
jgi:hypothetical protein